MQDESVNEDTYQVLKKVEVPVQSDFDSAIKPLWVKSKEKSPYSVFVATPVHSEVSIHYTQALLEFQKKCVEKKIAVNFELVKSSLVTQGRNICVSNFLSQPKFTHLLFIDSDIYFHSDSIVKMLEKDKDIISIPYPLKTIRWDKVFDKIKKGEITNENEIYKWTNTYPMKMKEKNFDVKRGVLEVHSSPTGCMLIKREVFDKLIKAYPDKNIVQKTIINGEYVTKPNMWNFFDTLHDPVEKTYLGEDFSFCKLWTDIGGKCHAYISDEISHIGEHAYTGRFADELIPAK